MSPRSRPSERPGSIAAISPKPSALEIVQAAQRVLTKPEYYAFWYVDCAGLSQRSAAAALMISRSTLRSRLEAARPKVAAEVERYAAEHAKTRRAKAARARRSPPPHEVSPPAA